jgi:hypothetical protein
MKTLKPILSLLFVLATGLALFVTSCTKEEEFVQDSTHPTWTVRPDFATLDTRPPDVIARYKVTEKDAVPVELIDLKAGGKYALVIGISDYSGTANDLTYCDDDATDWKARLQTEGYSVTVLLDRNATKTSIEDAVDALAGQSIAGNEIALCYSGHGSKGNIVTTDLYYISSTWFKTKFANATSTKMMFCFDACQIGAMATDLNGTGRVIAVASNKTSYSYDGDNSQQNGVFTYFQMKGFDTMGYIYLEPDCQYACDQFKLWAKPYRIRVVPSYQDSFTGDFDL